MATAVDIHAYFRRLWRGRITEPENVRWFVPVWLWFGLVVWVELQKLPENILFITFFPVIFLSWVPVFCGRVGLTRWWVFGWVVPVMVSLVVIECLRWMLHSV